MRKRAPEEEPVRPTFVARLGSPLSGLDPPFSQKSMEALQLLFYDQVSSSRKAGPLQSVEAVKDAVSGTGHV